MRIVNQERSNLYCACKQTAQIDQSQLSLLREYYNVRYWLYQALLQLPLYDKKKERKSRAASLG